MRRRIMLSRTGDDPLRFLSAHCDIEGVKLIEATELESPHRDPLRYTELEIDVPDSLPLGKASGIVTIRTSHDENPLIGLPIQIDVLSPIEVYPSTLVLTIGNSGILGGTVRMRSRLGHSLRIANVTLESGLGGAASYEESSDDTIELIYALSQVDLPSRNECGDIIVSFDIESLDEVYIPIKMVGL